MDKAGGRVTRPGSHSSRPKREGSATLENSIADRAALVEGAGVRTGALERAKITPEACAAGRRAADHTDAGRVWALYGRYWPRSGVRAGHAARAGAGENRAGSNRTKSLMRVRSVRLVEKQRFQAVFQTLSASRTRGVASFPPPINRTEK